MQKILVDKILVMYTQPLIYNVVVFAKKRFVLNKTYIKKRKKYPWFFLGQTDINTYSGDLKSRRVGI